MNSTGDRLSIRYRNCNQQSTTYISFLLTVMKKYINLNDYSTPLIANIPGSYRLISVKGRLTYVWEWGIEEMDYEYFSIIHRGFYF
jgi:hypothetical protein